MTTAVRQSSLGAFHAVTLENRRLRVVILPELGGRVWELRDLERRRQWIWQRGNDWLAAHPVGTGYDAVWAGGWEELFPNDAPGRFEDRELPDHGEWWATPWRMVECEQGRAGRVKLAATLRVIRAECEKEFVLGADDGLLSVSYRIRSREQKGFHFLFKQHLPVALTPQCRLLLPGGRVELVDPAFGNLLHGASPFDWPLAATRNGAVDLRRIPPAACRQREFLYVTDLPDGWCGIRDDAAGAAIRMNFDLQRLPFVWLFLSYGGWQSLYTAVLEPCTNLPKDLSEAVRLGRSAWLEPGQVFETTVSVMVEGSSAGAGIS